MFQLTIIPSAIPLWPYCLYHMSVHHLLTATSIPFCHHLLAAQLEKMHVFCTYLSPLHNTNPAELIHQLCELIEFQLKMSSRSSLKKMSRSWPQGEQFLVIWAVPQLHDIDELAKKVDPSIKGARPMKLFLRFAYIISSCVEGRYFCTYTGCFWNILKLCMNYLACCLYFLLAFEFSTIVFV